MGKMVSRLFDGYCCFSTGARANKSNQCSLSRNISQYYVRQSNTEYKVINKLWMFCEGPLNIYVSFCFPEFMSFVSFTCVRIFALSVE